MSLISSLAADIHARRRRGLLLYQSDHNLESLRPLLATLQAIQAGFDRTASQDTADTAKPDATTRVVARRVEMAISVLQTLMHEMLLTVHSKDAKVDAALTRWDEQKQAEVATLFGVKFDLLQGQAKPLFGPIYQARLLAALMTAANSAKGAQLDAQKATIAHQPTMLLIEKGFYREAYQIGRLSLSVVATDPTTSWVDPITARQPAAALDAAVHALHQISGPACANLMHLMSVTVLGLAEFTLAARHLPPIALTLAMPFLQDLRHVHIHVGPLSSKGYLFEVTAFLETQDFTREALLTFALRIDASGRMALHFMRPTEMRIVLVEDSTTPVYSS